MNKRVIRVDHLRKVVDYLEKHKVVEVEISIHSALEGEVQFFGGEHQIYLYAGVTILRDSGLPEMAWKGPQILRKEFL